MYKIDAFIRMERLEEVKNALLTQGIDDFAVTEAFGHGSHEGSTACYRGVTYEIAFAHRARIELVVSESSLDAVIECIRNSAHTGRAGDGQILVIQLDDAIEISVDRPAAGLQDRPTKRSRLASTVEASSANLW